MAYFFKKLTDRLGHIADSINGNITSPDSPGKDEKATGSGNRPDVTTIFDNAIDKRDIAVKALLNEFRQATGSTSNAIASLFIYVIVDREDYDVKKYSWADDTMKEHLRLELDNAMLEGVGRNRIEIDLITSDKLPQSSIEIIGGHLYYSFVTPHRRKEKTVRAKITVVEGTGSIDNSHYILDSEAGHVFHIGRGTLSTKPGAYRPNDIVIRSDDPDRNLQSANNHVSSAHADIVAENGNFYLKALQWGCRPMGGASTKLIHGGESHEIKDTAMKHPLHDGDLIELGRQVILLFSTSDI